MKLLLTEFDQFFDPSNVQTTDLLNAQLKALLVQVIPFIQPGDELNPELRDLFSHVWNTPGVPQELQTIFQPHTTIAIDKGMGLSGELEFALSRAVHLLFHPEFVFPLGYDEMRLSASPVYPKDVDESAAGFVSELTRERLETYDYSSSVDIVKAMLDWLAFTTISRIQYRGKSGTWHSIEGVLDKIMPFGEQSARSFGEGMLQNWRQKVSATHAVSGSFWLPHLNADELIASNTLGPSVAKILESIGGNQSSLRDVHWRELEEIVAELLKQAGLRVTITPRTRDGGRDIIARGDLIPGEPTVLAVEVKHKEVVGIGDFRAAMYANRHFPALLFATSGRFSGGIFEERYQNENRLRLLLKDGIALRQWIDDYCARRNGR